QSRYRLPPGRLRHGLLRRQAAAAGESGEGGAQGPAPDLPAGADLPAADRAGEPRLSRPAAVVGNDVRARATRRASARTRAARRVWARPPRRLPRERAFLRPAETARVRDDADEQAEDRAPRRAGVRN